MSGRPNCPHWLLALTIPFSRSDRARTGFAGGGAGWPEGLFRTDCSAGESPSAVRRPWEAVPTGCTPYQTAGAPSTRFLQTGRKRPRKARRPSEGTLGKPHGLDTELPQSTEGTEPHPRIHSAGAAGSRFHAKIPVPFLAETGSAPREGSERPLAHSYTGRGVRRAAWTPRTPPGVRSSTGFPLHPIPSPWDRPGGACAAR